MGVITFRHDLHLNELREIPPRELCGVKLTGISPTTDYVYMLGFYVDDPSVHHTSAHITTESRDDFLEKGHERQAQVKHLKDLYDAS